MCAVYKLSELLQKRTTSDKRWGHSCPGPSSSLRPWICLVTSCLVESVFEYSHATSSSLSVFGTQHLFELVCEFAELLRPWLCQIHKLTSATSKWLDINNSDDATCWPLCAQCYVVLGWFQLPLAMQSKNKNHGLLHQYWIMNTESIV